LLAGPSGAGRGPHRRGPHPHCPLPFELGAVRPARDQRARRVGSERGPARAALRASVRGHAAARRAGNRGRPAPRQPAGRGPGGVAMLILLTAALALTPASRLQRDAEDKARAEVTDLFRTLCPEQCVLLSLKARVEEEPVGTADPGFDAPGDLKVPVL